MKHWTITLGQVAPALLDTEKNARTAMRLLEDCAERNSNLLVLPELFLTGYSIEEALLSPKDTETLKDGIIKNRRLILQKTTETPVDILLSYPLFDEAVSRPYIALEYISNGKSLALHRKINLCNYAQYREHLTFSAGDEIVIADTLYGKAGLFVCEDLWHVTNAIFAAHAGAEAIFYPSAATALKKEDAPQCLQNWKKLTMGTAFSQTSYIICCNQAASQSKLYFGGSHVAAPDGSIAAELPLFDEAVSDVTLDFDFLEAIRKMRPLIKNERLNVYKKYIK